MPFGAQKGKGKGKGKGFNLDCVLGNVSITIVTCCGYVFQGVIVEEDDDKFRAQYGCPIVFPTMTMDYGHDKDDDKKDCKDDDDKDDKKHHCPKPQPIEVDVDVKCDNDPKFICLRLTCVPGNICCLDGTSGLSLVTSIRDTTGSAMNLFDIDDVVLIDVDDIVAVGPFRGCLTVPVA